MRLSKSLFFCTLGLVFQAVLAHGLYGETNFSEKINELGSLKENAGDYRTEFDALWKQTLKIAEMNDKCGTIDLTATIDKSCENFYQVELPKWEREYMAVTGEIRLSSMNLNETKQRAKNISTCSDYLVNMFLVPPQKFNELTMDRLQNEPLNRDGTQIELDYKFTLNYDGKKMRGFRNLASIWMERCRDIVENTDKNGLAPLFITNLNEANDSIANTILDAKVEIHGYILIFKSATNAGGYYSINGRPLFSSAGKDMGAYLIMDLKNGTTDDKRNPPLVFSGKEKVYLDSPDLVGKWIWNERGKMPEPTPVYAPEPEPEYEPEQEEYVEEEPESKTYVEEAATDDETDYSSASFSYGYGYSNSSSYEQNDYEQNDYEPSDSEQSDYDNTYTSESDDSDNSTSGFASRQKTSEVNLRISLLGAILPTFGPGFDETDEDLRMSFPEPWSMDPAEADENISMVNSYIAALLHVDINHFSLALGAGLAWVKASITDENVTYSNGSDEYILADNRVAPVFIAEMAYITSSQEGVANPKGFDITMTFGLRSTMIFDSQWETIYIGPFVEYGILGAEVGWTNSSGFWSNLYFGFSLRIPTKKTWDFLFGKDK